MHAKFRRLKRRSIKDYYQSFFNDLKKSKSSKWFSICKKIGLNQNENEVLRVEELKNDSNKEAADKVAHNFAIVSQEYSPLDLTKVPCYLPSQKPPEIHEYEVAKKMEKMKKNMKCLIFLDQVLLYQCIILINL